MYKIVAEKPVRVQQSIWRNKQCANAYCSILQARWKNEKFIVQRLASCSTTPSYTLSSRIAHCGRNGLLNNNTQKDLT
jgi:hypothetical protein